MLWQQMKRCHNMQKVLFVKIVAVSQEMLMYQQCNLIIVYDIL